MGSENGLPLQFLLDSRSGVPFYKQIINQVELAVADHRISHGEQLPTVRSLAVELSVNPNTVSRAYNELEIRGIVNTQQGLGTFISDRRVELSPSERDRILAELTRPFLASAGTYGYSLKDVILYLQRIQEAE